MDAMSLPPALKEVAAPSCLSPSKFADLRRCPLSVLHGLRGSEQLPPHPSAVLGTIMHDVMHEVRRNPTVLGDDPARVVEAVFDRLRRKAEVGLKEDPATSRLVPLDRAVGMTRWLQRKYRLLKWAGSLAARDGALDRSAGRADRDGAYPRPGSGSGGEATRVLPIGSERALRVPELRLAGRVDLLERDADGTVHVTDLKSGAVSDEDGDPLPEYALQLRMYALMVEAIDPGATVRLWLEGAERVEVPWGEGDRSETAQLLTEVLSDLPEGGLLAADSLARPGSHCRWCRIRHRCPGYRRAAPAWWENVSTTEPVAPFDTWGSPIDVEAREAGAYDVTLRDVAGRWVIVSGVVSAPWMGEVDAGTMLWFFELELSETLPLHGAYAHPRNFHERRRSRNRSDVLRLQVFVGPDDSRQDPAR